MAGRLYHGFLNLTLLGNTPPPGNRGTDIHHHTATISDANA